MEDLFTFNRLYILAWHVNNRLAFLSPVLITLVFSPLTLRIMGSFLTPLSYMSIPQHYL